MSKNLMIKLTVDLAMTILMVLAMAYHFTGNLWHEIIGVALFLHSFLNRRWYTAILKGKYDLKRALNTTTNLFLVVIMATTAVSGVLLSRDLFSAITFGDDLLIRRIHTAAAHWGYLLVGVHLGMHWTMVLGGFRRMAKTARPNGARTIILRCIALGIALWGVRASFERNIWSQLTSRFTFSFWDPGQSAAGYLLSSGCIMGLYAVIAYYILSTFRRKDRKKP